MVALRRNVGCVLKITLNMIPLKYSGIPYQIYDNPLITDLEKGSIRLGRMYAIGRRRHVRSHKILRREKFIEKGVSVYLSVMSRQRLPKTVKFCIEMQSM